jgi:hypothetical protein
VSCPKQVLGCPKPNPDLYCPKKLDQGKASFENVRKFTIVKIRKGDKLLGTTDQVTNPQQALPVYNLQQTFYPGQQSEAAHSVTY